jgi:hypothetical protein
MNIGRVVGISIFMMSVAVVAFFLFMALHAAYGRDLGQWENSPAEVRAWFRSLKQPDSLGSLFPTSCCGEGDAYWADEYHITEDGKLIAVITDDRDDGPLQRFHVPIGTRFVVPNNKIVDATKQGGNPTGHTIIFLGGISLINNQSNPAARAVLCWVGGGGS